MFRSVKQWTAVAALTVVVASLAWADASGKWTWKQRGRQQGNEVTMTLELKQDGEKLTGSVMREGADQKSDISEGKIKENELSFAVVREFNGNQFKTMYKGKMDGDTIKGNFVTNFGGQERTTEWTATRAK
jgi:hypothetical protein